MPSSCGSAIETVGLSKRFGRQLAVDNLSLQVPAGSVFAFLGRNGAGKTTTIRMMLNLLPRTSGEARLLGLDSARDVLEIKRRTGYVAEAQRMYDWMKVDEIIWFCKGFYRTWDERLAADLKLKLQLPGDKKVGQLSRGMQAKLALLLALAPNPELLILDEPTAGLDVLVRRDFLESVVALIQEEGRTVFFSSHLVHEVERVADWVGLLDHGKLIWCSTLEDLKAKVKRLVLTFDSILPPLDRLPNALTVETAGRQAAVVTSDFSDEVLAAVKRANPTAVRVQDLSLEEIFVALVGEPEAG
jgi:ABC-2 type transport system ATP-binding protein